ncbi:MAG: 2-phospho-L-lactate guanylyltransferase [Chloroflexi bacterium]|nr:2-phospho-L-lactate guanylyltransferase [Chloroflexota bacterium]
MATAAIVPLRSLHDGKQRLSGVLSSAERGALVQQLFLRAHAAILGSGCVDLLCVVSPDADLLAWVERAGAVPLLQSDAGLNAGLEYARHTLTERGSWSSLLVVLPDLPLIQATDIAAMARLSQPQSIVIASDRHGSGTNALLMQPASAIPFRFGAHSLQRHLAAARSHGLTIKRYTASSVAFDLDTAEDLNLLRESDVSSQPLSGPGI